MHSEQIEIGGRQAFLAMLGLCLATSLTALDQTVVGTAMPRVVAELRGFSFYAWVGTSYLLTSAVTMPLAGKLGDLYGRKPLVLFAIVLFTLASVLCGKANGMLMLVLSRALQGVGSGVLIGTSFASITDLFPDTVRRIRWMVMITTTFAIANALGPGLGGFLTEHWGWRSVFLVNLPVGILALLVVHRYLPRFRGHRQPGERIDWLDGTLLALAMGLLLYALEEGRKIGYASPIFIAAVVGGGVSGWLFFSRLNKAKTPIIPPRMLVLPAVRRLGIGGFLSGFVMFTLIFYMPLLLQGGYDRSPRAAGLLLTPLGTCIPIGSLINGRLLPRIKWGHHFLSCGMVLTALTCVLLFLMDGTTSDYSMMAIFAVCGISFGFQFPNFNLQMQSAVQRSDTGAGAALINTTRMFGSMIAASFAGLLVDYFYVTQVTSALQANHLAGHAQVQALLANPQVLVRASDQGALAQALAGTGVQMDTLLDVARGGLVSGVHAAVLFGAVLALLGGWVCWKLPPLPLQRKIDGHKPH